MYFWKTRNLAIDIKENKLDESTKIKYYFGSIIITSFNTYLLKFTPANTFSIPYYSYFVEFFLYILICYLGIKIAFKSNNGNHGKNYLERLIIIAFPLLLKCTVLGFVIGIISALAESTFADKVLNYSINSLGSLLVLVWYFWRINIYIKLINNNAF